MIHLDVYGTLVAATLVLLLGRQMVQKILLNEIYYPRTCCRWFAGRSGVSLVKTDHGL